MTETEPCPNSTPWGLAKTIHGYGPGISFVTTHHHGGYWVSQKNLEHRLPIEIISATYRQDGLRGWFEQDRDGHWIPVMFPERFNADQVVTARKNTETMFPELFAQHAPKHVKPNYREAREQIERYIEKIQNRSNTDVRQYVKGMKDALAIFEGTLEIPAEDS